MNNQIAGVNKLIFFFFGGGGWEKGWPRRLHSASFFYFATFSFRKLNRKLKSNPEFYKKSQTLLTSFQGIYILFTHVVHSTICILRAHIPLVINCNKTKEYGNGGLAPINWPVGRSAGSSILAGSQRNFFMDFMEWIPTTGLRPKDRLSWTLIFIGGVYNSSLGRYCEHKNNEVLWKICNTRIPFSII